MINKKQVGGIKSFSAGNPRCQTQKAHLSFMDHRILRKSKCLAVKKKYKHTRYDNQAQSIILKNMPILTSMRI